MNHRFFLDHAYSGQAGIQEIPGPPWTDALPAEFRYVYDVIEAALPQISAQNLTFHITKEAYFLPSYGPNVVAILLQEERCKVPVYGRHIRAVIRNLSEKPFLGFRAHLHPSKLESVLMFEYLRDSYTSARSRFFQAFPPRNFPAPVREEPVVAHLPLGYHRQLDLPQIPMADRPLDTFFAGQVRHEVSKNSYVHWLSSSKFEARTQLWTELEKLQRDGRWNIELGNIAGDQRTHASYDSYSEKMMQSKICVSPRGSMAECYRTYEGLRAGCMVVANPQQPDNFLGPGAPVYVLDRWSDFEGVLERFARNYDALEEWRAKGLAWWHDRLRPEAVATDVARTLNYAGDTLRV